MENREIIVTEYLLPMIDSLTSYVLLGDIDKRMGSILLGYLRDLEYAITETNLAQIKYYETLSMSEKE